MPAPRCRLEAPRDPLTGAPGRRRWLELALLVAGVAIAAGLYDKRGAVVGALAVVVYASLWAAWTLRREPVIAWSRDHPWIDGLLTIPFVFLLLAYLTDIAVGGCVVIAAVVWLVLLPLTLRRRPRSSETPPE